MVLDIVYLSRLQIVTVLDIVYLSRLQIVTIAIYRPGGYRKRTIQFSGLFSIFWTYSRCKVVETAPLRASRSRSYRVFRYLLFLLKYRVSLDSERSFSLE